jgi:RNA polymerase sigma-70 factor (ECF subfamily)
MTSVVVAEAERLFLLHRQGVFRYLSRAVGRPETAQDLTQEVFLRVARSPVPVSDPAGHRAWVFKIARNLLLNHLRDGARRGEVVALDELDRDVFLMRESAGLSYAEIAGACELTEDAVRARLKRAREELRQALSGPLRTGRRGLVAFHRLDRDRGENHD